MKIKEINVYDTTVGVLITQISIYSIWDITYVPAAPQPRPKVLTKIECFINYNNSTDVPPTLY